MNYNSKNSSKLNAETYIDQGGLWCYAKIDQIGLTIERGD